MSILGTGLLKGYHPCSEDGAVYLAGIVLSITHGDYNPAMHSAEFLKCVNSIMYSYNHVICTFSDKLGQLIPPKMAQSKRKGEFVKRILEQYEQVLKDDISDHTVSHVREDWI